MTISKAQLEHGAYYAGMCRNARVARWNAQNQRFYYWRSKWERSYVMKLPHEEDQRGFDFFQPSCRLSLPSRILTGWERTNGWWFGKRVLAFVHWLWRKRFTIPFRTDAGDDG